MKDNRERNFIALMVALCAICIAALAILCPAGKVYDKDNKMAQILGLPMEGYNEKIDKFVTNNDKITINGEDVIQSFHDRAKDREFRKELIEAAQNAPQREEGESLFHSKENRVDFKQLLEERAKDNNTKPEEAKAPELSEDIAISDAAEKAE